MPTPEDELFGRIALESKLVSKNQLSRALADLETRLDAGEEITVGDLLREQGVITEIQFVSIRNAQLYRQRRHEDKSLGRKLIRRELVGRDAIEASLEEQKSEYSRTGKCRPLGAILIERGDVDKDAYDEFAKQVELRRAMKRRTKTMTDGAIPATSGRFRSIQGPGGESKPAPGGPVPEGMKACPLCERPIKSEAVRCRYCKRDLPKATKPQVIELTQRPAPGLAAAVSGADLAAADVSSEPSDADLASESGSLHAPMGPAVEITGLDDSDASEPVPDDGGEPVAAPSAPSASEPGAAEEPEEAERPESDEADEEVPAPDEREDPEEPEEPEVALEDSTAASDLGEEEVLLEGDSAERPSWAAAAFEDRVPASISSSSQDSEPAEDVEVEAARTRVDDNDSLEELESIEEIASGEDLEEDSDDDEDDAADGEPEAAAAPPPDAPMLETFDADSDALDDFDDDDFADDDEDDSDEEIIEEVVEELVDDDDDEDDDEEEEVVEEVVEEILGEADSDSDEVEEEVVEEIVGEDAADSDDDDDEEEEDDADADGTPDGFVDGPDAPRSEDEDTVDEADAREAVAVAAESSGVASVAAAAVEEAAAMAVASTTTALATPSALAGGSDAMSPEAMTPLSDVDLEDSAGVPSGERAALTVVPAGGGSGVPQDIGLLSDAVDSADMMESHERAALGADATTVAPPEEAEADEKPTATDEASEETAPPLSETEAPTVYDGASPVVDQELAPAPLDAPTEEIDGDEDADDADGAEVGGSSQTIGPNPDPAEAATDDAGDGSPFDSEAVTDDHTAGAPMLADAASAGRAPGVSMETAADAAESLPALMSSLVRSELTDTVMEDSFDRSEPRLGSVPVTEERVRAAFERAQRLAFRTFLHELGLDEVAGFLGEADDPDESDDDIDADGVEELTA